MDLLQSPNRVGRISVANNVTDTQAVAAAGIQLGSIAREKRCRKSKKLMSWIKEIYSARRVRRVSIRRFICYFLWAEAPAANSRSVVRNPAAVCGSESASSATVAEN